MGLVAALSAHFLRPKIRGPAGTPVPPAVLAFHFAVATASALLAGGNKQVGTRHFKMVIMSLCCPNVINTSSFGCQVQKAFAEALPDTSPLLVRLGSSTQKFARASVVEKHIHTMVQFPLRSMPVVSKNKASKDLRKCLEFVKYVCQGHNKIWQVRFDVWGLRRACICDLREVCACSMHVK